MARTKQTARVSTGGKAPRKQLATSSTGGKGGKVTKGKSSYAESKGKGGKAFKGAILPEFSKGKGGKSFKQASVLDFPKEGKATKSGAPKGKGGKSFKASKCALGSWAMEENGDDNEDDEDEDTQQTPEDTASKDDVLQSFDAAGKNVEVVFSFDTTGSMYSCLQQVRTKLRETVTRLIEDVPNIRIGIMAHGDYFDHKEYVVRYEDLTSNVDDLVDFVTSVPCTCGGDLPEAYEWVLRKAQHLDWSEDSAKALVVIGDCCPHPVSYTDQRVNWHDELEVLKGMGVKVYGVKALHQPDSYPFYKELADRTGGCFIKFSNFSIITEMFLAVCYREADRRQLEAYCEAVKKEGRMTTEVEEMLQQVQVDSAPPQDKHQSQNYVAAAWWDTELDQGSPQYSYDIEADQWGPYTPTKKTSAKSVTYNPRKRASTKITGKKTPTPAKSAKKKKVPTATLR